MPSFAALPDIPLLPVGKGGGDAVARLAESQFHDLFAGARRLYTPPVLAAADRLSRAWLERADNPYLAEMDRVAALIGKPGAYALNTSYEWCCTSGVAADPQGGVRLLRVLDWRQPGLGRNVVAARQDGPAGPFVNLTWPGFTGVLTAMAPGRFAAAINQPPMPSWGLGLPLNWAVSRTRVWKSRALPPAHLLRRVFETCASYGEARAILSETPLSLPAFFTLAGASPGEGCVIERTEDKAAVREMPAAIANHWTALPRPGRPRGRDSHGRLALMQAALAGETDWQTAPILNRDTRLVAEMNAAAGRLSAEGWEASGPVTRRLEVAEA